MSMERVILFEPFGFLGYSLCKALLEAGIQVNAISGAGNDWLTEEKRMEIGRNANFIENNIKEESLKEAIEPNISIIMPIYDLFIKNAEMNCEIDECFYSLFNDHHPTSFPVTFLLPEQYAYESNLSSDSIVEFIRKVHKKGYRCKEIYLPTLYGPWQPEEYLFHQLIVRRSEHLPALHERESITDAIYIEDAAHAVLEALVRKEEKFLITSGSASSWMECLNDLVDDHWAQQAELSEWRQQMEEIRVSSCEAKQKWWTEDDLHTIYIENPLSMTNGLELQRKQDECRGKPK